uniref:DUF6598 domain-containing protein n=1 Tax=Oryza punctata TaxID=4537 RepID=A0A0E0KX65_ORYPU
MDQHQCLRKRLHACITLMFAASMPAMRYTHGPIARYACCDRTLQIFSIQVVRIKRGLEWPLHVYGLVAVRDSVDHNRNLLFHRTRDDCQILTQKDSFLELTGPSRAILIVDPVEFDVELKVKERRESDDQILSFQLFGQNGVFDVKQSVMLDTETMPIGSDDDVIKLSRRVVTVELSGQLTVCVAATQVAGQRSTRDDGGIAQNKAPSTTDEVRFRPKKSGESCATCELGFCGVEITVAWSLLNCDNIA